MQLDDLLAYRLTVCAKKVSQHLALVYEKEYHLSRDEWRLLAALGGAGTASSLAVAATTTMDKVQVCRAANRLEAKGLLTRDVLPDDKRLRVFSLTGKGRDLFGRMVPDVLRQNAKMQRLLNDQELEVLNKALSKLSVG